jgi:hypothetical protein
MEKNHGKDEKHGKEEDGQMADDKSPMTNFFPGYPGSIAPPPRPVLLVDLSASANGIRRPL